jgi:ATP-binding protein involved in chromosome partitioning
LAQKGWRVGLLDADVHGPSLPQMMGIQEKPQVTEDKKMIPLIRHGVACLSIGFLVSSEGAVVWRGPMVQSALRQLLQESAWEGLDLLILDMPPGTGDAHLAVAQMAGLTGAILVSTPQEIALSDARRGASLFEKVHVPLLGMIETMSLFHCSQCGHEEAIFGHGGAEEEASRLGVSFWGSIPLDKNVRLMSDQGVPVVLSAPQSPGGQAYLRAVNFLEEWLKSSPS